MPFCDTNITTTSALQVWRNIIHWLFNNKTLFQRCHLRFVVRMALYLGQSHHLIRLHESEEVPLTNSFQHFFVRTSTESYYRQLCPHKRKIPFDGINELLRCDTAILRSLLLKFLATIHEQTKAKNVHCSYMNGHKTKRNDDSRNVGIGIESEYFRWVVSRQTVDVIRELLVFVASRNDVSRFVEWESGWEHLIMEPSLAERIQQSLVIIIRHSASVLDLTEHVSDARPIDTLSHRIDVSL